MAAIKSRIAVKDLSPGMYVCELDRPWCQTPFPLQGFYISDVADVKAIASFCQFVYIDIPLSRGDFDHLVSGSENASQRVKQLGQDADSKDESVTKVAPIRIKSPVSYETKTPMRKAVKQAKALIRDVESTINQLYRDIEIGLEPDIETTEKVAGKLVKSVTDNPDALIWLARVQNKDEHTYYHAVSASIWGLVLGRQMGLEANVLETLATGLLLSQIGKAKLPKDLLERSNYLSAEDFRIYQSYVMEGVEMLKEDPAVSPQVISVVEYHRERHNGSGFPKGLTGEKIPLLAKIAGLVDRFQELIQPRPGIDPLGPAQAIAVLFQGSNIEFQSDLLERFVSAVGVYPTGSIVELTSSDIGVVVSPNEDRKLWPTVMLIGEQARKNKMAGKLVNLKEFNEKQKSETRYVQVANTLPQDSYDIEAKDLMVATGSRWPLRGLF